jgi:hypothetical protein
LNILVKATLPRSPKIRSKQPELFQEFQDRHTSLRYLITKSVAKLGQQLGAEISKTSALEISQPTAIGQGLAMTCVYLKDLLAYKEHRDRERREALDQMAKEAEDLGLDDNVLLPGE